jgi:hypothetical protein
MKAPLPGTAVRTELELGRIWQRLMGPEGFGTRSLWLLLLDEQSRLTPRIVPLDELPAEPDLRGLRNLAAVVAELIDTSDVASVAVLLSRPGSRAMTDTDRRWAAAVLAALGEYTRWPVHLATRGQVQVFAPDDLVAAS